jgi:hypothetical protein
MHCPLCGAENPDDAYFCGSCGAQLRSSFGEPTVLPSAEPAPAAEPANPFGASEPHASAAFEQLQQPVPPPPPPVNPYAPGAGVAPPPTAPGTWTAAPPPATAPGAWNAPQPPPPPQYPPPPSPQYPPPAAYPPPPAQAGYQQQYGLPPDGNTSGMGQGYPAPPEASGWTFAGFVPWGLFGFLNGDTTWGVVGLALWFFGFYIVYAIYMGITGRESAWRNRRFNSVYEYAETMRVWNYWGMGCLGAGCLGICLYFIFVFVVAISASSH